MSWRTLFKASMPNLSHRVTQAESKATYQRPNSLSKHWVLRDVLPGESIFLMSDGKSLGAGFELFPIACEGRSETFVQELSERFEPLFQDALEKYPDEASPWVLQWYVEDDNDLSRFHETFNTYCQTKATLTGHTQALLKQHLDDFSHSEAFTDKRVTGLPFSVKVRRVRLLFYRRLHGKSDLRYHQNALNDVKAAQLAISSQCQAMGVAYEALTPHAMQDWLQGWFNPGRDKLTWDIDDFPFGVDLSELPFTSEPMSNKDTGFWYFNDKPHYYLPVSGLQRLPQAGHLFAERGPMGRCHALFDQGGLGSRFVMTVVVQDQSIVQRRIERLLKSAKRAQGAEKDLSVSVANDALALMARGSTFYPATMGFYLRGENDAYLQQQMLQLQSVLQSHQLTTIKPHDNTVALHRYLHQLPFNYQFDFDKAWLKDSRYYSSKQLAKLVPLYGRERGTGNPGFVFFNRGGEPITIDPLNPLDKSSNSHLLLLGTTGAGKSALMIYLMLLLMSVRRPKLVCVEGGNSFMHLCAHFKKQDVSVFRIEINESASASLSLNPFMDSHQLLAQIEALKSQEAKLQQALSKSNQSLESAMEDDWQSDTSTGYGRDYLSEMTLAACLMITGGIDSEAIITRAERQLIMQALLRAAETAKAAEHSQMVASDVSSALKAMHQDKDLTVTANQRDRLLEFALSLDAFCADPITARFFNRRGEPWPDADVTVLELGLFKDRDDYEPQRTLALVTLMTRAMTWAEQSQYQGNRETVFVGDECHLLMNNPFSRAMLTQCAKMSRKVALWLWLMSQNVKDFPDDARRLLAMMEFVLCLGLKKEEINLVSNITEVTEEAHELLRTIRKSPKQYVEGVLLQDDKAIRFRNIPPKFILALGMTEKTEKHELQQLAKQEGATLLEAIELLAERMRVNKT